jgi:beta-glucosidase
LVGNEGRALGVDLVYGPQVDLTRLPNWSRNDATYGEDPYLTGQLAIEEVTGIQSRGLMSEVKHFAMYNGQNGAGIGTAGPPTIVDDQTAHELYLKAYEYPVTQGKVSSIMASYQGFQITPLESSPNWASDNPLTLTTILRGQWGFVGFVLSDYGATHSEGKQVSIHVNKRELSWSTPAENWVLPRGERKINFLSCHVGSLVRLNNIFDCVVCGLNDFL